MGDLHCVSPGPHSPINPPHAIPQTTGARRGQLGFPALSLISSPLSHLKKPYHKDIFDGPVIHLKTQVIWMFLYKDLLWEGKYLFSHMRYLLPYSGFWERRIDGGYAFQWLYSNVEVKKGLHIWSSIAQSPSCVKWRYLSTDFVLTLLERVNLTNPDHIITKTRIHQK